MATYLRWEETDIKYHLCGSLEGAAGLVLADLAPEATSEDVIRLLKTRFGTETDMPTFPLLAESFRISTVFSAIPRGICEIPLFFICVPLIHL